MNKLLMPFIVIVCLLLTACDKDKILPGGPMTWSWEILTPENVKWTGGTLGWVPEHHFKANSKEGDIVMTCKNFEALDPIYGDSYTYDCEWAALKIEANQLKIHFPPYNSEAPDAYEEITISTNDGERKARTIICLSRTFKEEQPDPKPETLPEESKFKMIMSGFTPFMHLDSPLPAPLDLLTFKITDTNGNNSPHGFPDFTQYYDSIVWCADAFPNTFKVYESKTTAGSSEEHFTSQWSSHFFNRGTIRMHLKGYCDGEVKYETPLDVTIYERDFLGLEWGPIVLQKPENLTTYCLLNTDYEYQVNDIVAKDGNPYSEIIPVNHKQLPDTDYLVAAQKAIKTLMETNIGNGQSAEGKKELFKCLPDKDVKFELYWENKTTRILMIHQLPNESDELAHEKYYLHLEPK